MKEFYKTDEETETCDGMCYSPERVLTEIFALESAYFNAIDGIDLSVVGSKFYLQEISRTISVISLHCRQRLFSYLLAVKQETGAAEYLALPDNRRIPLLEEKYPTADVAIKSCCGYEICESGEIKELSYFHCIRKICHVERWSFPVLFKISGISEECILAGNIDKHLLIEVAKSDSKIGMGRTDSVIVDVPAFTAASRVLVTECEECNLPPVGVFTLDTDSTCS